MTVMQIPIPDDLKEAFEKAFPGETIEQAVQRLLRAEVERRQVAPRSNQGLVEMARQIRERTPPTSREEIRRLREEGRP